MGGRAPWPHALAPKSVEEETFYIKGSSERRPDGPCGEPDQARPVKRSGESRSFSYSPSSFAVFPGVPVFSRRPSAVPVSLFPFPVANRARSAGRELRAGLTTLPRRPRPRARFCLSFRLFPRPSPALFEAPGLARLILPRRGACGGAGARRLRKRRGFSVKSPGGRGMGPNRAARAACSPVFFFFFFFFFLSFCFEVDRVGLSPAQGAVRILRPALF